MIQANFDVIARAYRWLEFFSFGPILQKCRTEFLPELRNCQRTLVLGDGDGRFTEQLLLENLEVKVLAIDNSRRMLALLCARAQRIGYPGRVQTLQQDIRELAIQGNFDSVVSHFFLDCLTNAEVERLLAVMQTQLQGSSLWTISEFALPERGLARTLGGLLVRGLYLCFHLITGLEVQKLPDYEPLLRQAGWTLQKQRLRLGGLLKSQLWHWTPEGKSNRTEELPFQEKV